MPPTLLLSSTTFIYGVLGLLGAIILVLAVYLFRYMLRRRRTAKTAAPDKSAKAAASESSPAAEPAFVLTGRPSILTRISRALLGMFAWFMVGAFLLILLPEETVDRWAQVVRLRSTPEAQEETIAFLYLGDEPRERDFHIRGVVRNISTMPIEKLDATVRLYSSDGQLVETVVVRMDTELINPDATAAFHLRFPEYAGQFTSYSVDFKLRNGEPVPYKDMRGARERG